ncbi:alpha/beta family hydrolase [Candidatus Poriferisodalis sp.]|uniref:alpha/beta hydrolase family protein n=1 Tax=Candidatus Poriferisodalis sp. TaxID=3101277 RepID=UPI003B02E81A
MPDRHRAKPRTARTEAGTRSVEALLLTPGAGGSAEHRTLVDIEAVLRERMPVRRHEFAYGRSGRRAPPRASNVAEELSSDLPQIAAELGVPQDRLAIGGRSFGGRVCSMAVAGGAVSAGLVLLSYPLHPPGRPERLRSDHFGRIGVPCLFVSGTNDPFATPDELRRHTQAIAGPVTLGFVDGAGHDPSTVAARRTVVDQVGLWLDQPAG